MTSRFHVVSTFHQLVRQSPRCQVEDHVNSLKPPGLPGCSRKPAHWRACSWPTNGFADRDCSGEKMKGQSIWQPLRAFHGNVGADPILGHLMALHFISWAFHWGAPWHCRNIKLANAVFVLLPSSGI